jgi:predicted PurR-regulated permease PerM
MIIISRHPYTCHNPARVLLSIYRIKIMQAHKPPILSFLKYLQVILFTATLLYLGKTLFIPLFFGLLIAIVMYPVCKWLERHGWSLLIVAILITLLFALVVWQLGVFSKDAPAILERLDGLLQQFQAWVSKKMGVATDIQNNWSKELTGLIGGVLKSTVQATINTLFIFFLTPIYTALFMYHRKILVQYLKLVTPGIYQPQLGVILQQTIHTYFNYIKGMVLVYLVVGILNSIGLFALGVDHPILFGMLCAIMTIIPYIGIVVSALLPISVVWLETGNILYPVGVIAVFGFVQYLEANVIFPKVVGTQLHVSTLAMLVAIIAGGIIWGVAGMVLFIPFVAILKIISDHIEGWKPINLLLSR